MAAYNLFPIMFSSCINFDSLEIMRILFMQESLGKNAASLLEEQFGSALSSFSNI